VGLGRVHPPILLTQVVVKKGQRNP
jgi:hypothetical protein